MSYLLNKKIKELIKDDLGLKEQRLNESLVAQEKQFQLNTDYLTGKNKENHKNLYKQYIKDFNDISAKLDSVDRSIASSNNSEYRNLKIDETYNMNATYLHELYFANISDVNSEIKMDSLTYMRLQRDFGTFDDWQKDFIACCMSSRDGYAVTGYSVYLRRYMNMIIDTESLNVPIGFLPVISLDVAEGAYYRDYLHDRKSYVLRMMKEFDWNHIEKRFKRVESSIKHITQDI